MTATDDMFAAGQAAVIDLASTRLLVSGDQLRSWFDESSIPNSVRGALAAWAFGDNGPLTFDAMQSRYSSRIAEIAALRAENQHLRTWITKADLLIETTAERDRLAVQVADLLRDCQEHHGGAR